MDPFLTPALYNGVGVVTVIVLVGLAVMRGKLVPGETHREALKAAAEQVRKAEDRADRWEAVALQVLRATERLAEPVSTAAKVLTTLPNPSRERADS